MTDLALVCPGVSAALLRQPMRLPALERLLSYSRAGLMVTASSPDLDAWQHEALQALELETSLAPSAPLTWLGATGEFKSGNWLHADPVWLTMSSVGMTLTPSPPWSESELPRVESLLREHLELNGMRWRVAGNRAFVHQSSALDIRTVSPRSAVREGLHDSLPQGPDGVVLRRLLTELQMLLHDQLADGAPNAVWFWGTGAIPKGPAANLRPMWTEAPFVRGVYRAHDADGRCAPLPATLDGLRSFDGSAVVVAAGDDLGEFERRWFEPALNALHSRRLRTIDLYLDGWQARIERSFLRRLIARPKAVTEWFR